MDIPLSTFYYGRKGKSSERLKLEQGLKDEIERFCLELPRYGYRRVTKELQ